MGFFTKADSSAAEQGELLPLSTERIRASLERLGINSDLDDEGDLYAGWDLGVLYFLIRGDKQEILFIQGYWRAQLSPAELREAVDFANEWNCSKFWPRTLARPIGDESVRLETSHVIDYEHGLTDAQLDQHIMSALHPSMGFFEALNERFPAAWAQATSED